MNLPTVPSRFLLLFVLVSVLGVSAASGQLCEAILPQLVTCDLDGNPCTLDCEWPGILPCTAFGPVPDGLACDDGNFCTEGEFCTASVCGGGTPVDCDDGNDCTLDDCDRFTGCLNSPLPDGTPCDDADLCTTGDACAAGACTPTGVLDCDDSNDCTADGCAPLTGCLNIPVADGSPCSDGDACTTGDECAAGTCIPSGVLDCDDTNSCTTDGCDPGTGCVNTPLLDGAPCDDGDACTAGEFCTAVVCGGGSAVDCDDGDSCTIDSCDPATGCVNAPLPDGSACDDGDLCTLGDACAGGVCLPSDVVDCDDGDPCTRDWCEPADGLCHYAAQPCPEIDCADGIDNDWDGLTDCEDPDCAGEPCADEGIACTADICRNGSCRHSPRDARCDDGLFCTGEERCVPGGPQSGPDGCMSGVAWCTDPGEECVEAERRCREIECRDGIDNDSDGTADCDDPDCPGASPEDCWDGVDNNCNGLVDCEDVEFCGADDDGDGHRVPPCGGDCDDGDPNVHPGRLEDCLTPIDDDCDGLINCADPDCTTDKDGDGQAPVPCGNDCDDADPNNYFMNLEDCADRRDNNCNTLVDCVDPECAGAGCDDGYACTVGDVCAGTVCRGEAQDGRCNDGLFCNGEETCVPGHSGAGPDGCLDGTDPCLPSEVCDEATDICLRDCVADAWEPDDLCAEAGSIVVTGAFHTRTHSLCPVEERDRVTFQAEAGSEYLLFTTGATDTRGVLTKAGCVEELAYNNDCSFDDPNFCIVWTATFTGRVVLTVDSGAGQAVTLKGEGGGWSPAAAGDGERAAPAPALSAPVAGQEATGAYILWYRSMEGACVPDGFEPEDDNCVTATEIVVTETPVTQTHSVCPAGDVDRFLFLGEAGVTYRFTTAGGTDTRGEVRDMNCATLLAASDSCQGDPSFCMDFTPDTTRPYSLNIYGQTAQTTGGYTFTYELAGGVGCQPDEREPDDACHQGTFLEVGPVEQALHGTVCPGRDVDTFRFIAQAGRRYVFQTEGMTDTLGRLERDDCGGAMAQSSTCGPDTVNFCIVWEAPATDAYKLRVQGSHPGVTGSYLLRFRQTDCPPDAWEPDGKCAQATALEVDETLKGQAHTICPGGEVDLFEFFGQAGATYRFFTEGPTDTAGAVLSADCKSFLLKDASCGGTDPNFCLTWTAPEAGIYKMGITGDDEGGPYDLLYQQVEDPGTGCTEDGAEPDDVCAQATAIVPGPAVQSVGRTLCPQDDRDHFRFEAQAGRTYRFWTTGPTDTMGNVRDAVCEKLVGNDDCDRPDDLNFCLTWTAPADGTYGVRVRGFSRSHTVGPYNFHYVIAR